MDKSTFIMSAILAIMTISILSGCGNTIHGIGQDINRIVRN